MPTPTQWTWLGVGTGIGLFFLLVRKGGGMNVPVITNASTQAFVDALPETARSSRWGDLAPVFLRVAAEENISPFLLAAFASRESYYGSALDAAMTGDNGNGLGLMQADRRYHAEFAASGDWKDPYKALKYVVLNVIRPAEFFFKKSPTTPNVQINSAQARVLSERAGKVVSPGIYRDPRPFIGLQLEKATVAAYNAGTLSVLRAVAAGLDPDAATTGSIRAGRSPLNSSVYLGDYATDVLRRKAELEARAS